MAGVSGVFREIGGVFRDAFSEWRRDNASLLAAALAYYAAFSLAPLAVLLILFSGSFVGAFGSPGGIIRPLGEVFGPEVASSLSSMMHGAGTQQSGPFAAGAASVFLFFGATGIFLNTTRGLNLIWGVEPRGGAVMNVLKQYSLSFVQLIAAGAIILLSAAVTVLIASTGRSLRGVLPINFTTLHLLNFLVFFLAVSVLFASTYKTLSGVRLRWGDVLYASAFTAALFFAGNVVIGLYVGAEDIGSAYGAASSIFILLFWLYYSAQIFFFGAELSKVYARKYGSHKKGA